MPQINLPRFSHSRITAALTLAVIGLSPLAAHADQTKAENATALDLGASWLSNTAPTSTDTAIFDNTLTGAFSSFSTGTSGNDPFWAAIRIADPGANILINGTAQTLTLNATPAGIAIDMSTATRDLTIKSNLEAANDQSWIIPTNRTVAIGDQTKGTGLLGANVITFSGGGTLAFSGTGNSFSGILSITRGTTNINFDSAAGVTTDVLSSNTFVTLASGTLNVQGGGRQTFANLTFRTGSSTISVPNGNTLTLNSFTKSSSGSVNLGVDGSTVFITPSAGSNGTSSNVIFASLGATPNGITDNSNLNPFVTLGYDHWAGADANGRAIAATYTNATNGTFTASVINNVRSDISTGTTDVAGQRWNDNASAHTVTITGANIHTARGILVTSDSLGGTITGGSIRAARSSTAGTAFAIIQNSTNADLTIASNVTTGLGTTPTRLVKAGPGRLILTNASNSFNGPIDLNEGILNVTSNGALGNPTSANTIINLNGGSLEATVDLNLYNGTPTTNPRPVFLAEKGGGLIVASTKTMTVSGLISGTGLLSKSGAGTLDIRSTANTFSGGLAVNAGAVRLSNTSGNSTGTGKISVNASGILEGIGVSTSDVIANAGGHIAPGTGSGNLGLITLAGLTLNAGSIYDYEASASANDLVRLTADLTVLPGAGINLLTTFGSPIINPGTYNLFQVSGAFPSDATLQSNLSVFNAAPGAAYTFGHSGAFITVNISGATSTGSDWAVNSGGSWINAANWTGGVPNGATAAVTFGPIVNPGPATVTLDQSVTAGTIAFNSPNGSYTIAPGAGGALTLNNGATAATITVTAGSHTISAPVSFTTAGLNTSVAAGQSLTFAGPITANAPLSHNGPGTLILTSATASKVTALSLAGTSNSWSTKLDLTTSALIIDATANKAAVIATLANQITSAAAGNWTGNGLTSSYVAAHASATTLSIVDNADLPGGGLTSFMGQTLNANSIIITPTLLGDADLSGIVDAVDFDIWFKHVGVFASTSSIGDFDHSGIVDAIDFDLWFKHVGLTSLPVVPVAAVPEPASLMLALPAAPLLLKRRK